MISFRIDDLVPCLVDTQTGDIVETEVIRVRRKSFLKKFNKNTGWEVNWGQFSDDTEIYALVLQGSVDIQGLIAIRYDSEAKAVYIPWACTAPQNNVWRYGKQKYRGVGGHLFAIAAELSVQHGFDGYMYAEAVDKDLYVYYCEKFGASYLPPINNPYRFLVSDAAAEEIRRNYNYEWTNEVL